MGLPLLGPGLGPLLFPGVVDTTHLGWAGEAILEYKPDVVVVIGDFWDLPSLSNYDLPGSKETIGRNILADIEVGNEAFIKLTQPMFDRMEQIYKNKQKLWRPQLHFLFGNHEHRITKVISNDPKLDGLLTPDALKTPGFTRHHFLKIVTIDGIRYCHYFPNPYTGKPIGGTIPNRLNHIGGSFVQGHQQGFLYGTKQYPGCIVEALKVYRSGGYTVNHFLKSYGNKIWYPGKKYRIGMVAKTW